MGLVTGKEAGQVEISAQNGKGRGKTKVQVRNRKAGLNVSPKTATLDALGATIQLTVYRFPNGSADGAVWTSSNPTVAAVDANGRVTAKSVGDVRIAAALGGDADTAMVYVQLPPPTAPPPPPATPITPSNSPAELPRVYLDTRMPTVTGSTIRVNAGGDLQAAIDRAQLGDEIVLEAGATFTGRFRLPAKSGDGWIIIRSAGTLPPEGTRVTPATAKNFAKLVGGYEPTVYAGPGARKYRLTGLEITTSTRETSAKRQIELEEGSSNIVIDRAYVHGHPDLAFVRCILLNADSAAVIDSHVSECHTKGFDSQAISSYQSRGPLKIVNNFLSGAGETLMLGGSTASVRGIVEDVEIRGNHITKDPAWFASDRWTVKNLLELKVGRRVLVEANLLEHNWVDAQDGDAINIKSLNDREGEATEDITLRNNILRYSDGGIQLANVDRVTLEGNLIEKLRYYKERGGMFSFSSGVRSLTLRRNTVRDVNGASLAGCTSALNPDAVIENNAFDRGNYGWKCGGASEGQPSLDEFYAPYIWKENSILADDPVRIGGRYPAGTEVVSSWSAVLSGRGADLSNLNSLEARARSGS